MTALVILGALLATLALPPAERPVMPTVRRILNRLAGRTANDDPQRSPDWCWTHNCHRSACPTPQH